LLVLCRGLLRAEGLYLALRYVYFTAYLIEDAAPLGPGGYHLTVLARRAAHPSMIREEIPRRDGTDPCERESTTGALAARLSTAERVGKRTARTMSRPSGAVKGVRGACRLT
jgi:hypothetical protein